MYGLGFGVGIKAYCPPGTGSRRTSIGETVVIGTVWIGMYWRPDGFRAHDAIRLDCDAHWESRHPTVATAATASDRPGFAAESGPDKHCRDLRLECDLASGHRESAAAAP